MKRLFLIFVFLLMTTHLGWSQQHHALLIGISDYPSGSGWNKLHSYNDVAIVKQALNGLNCGFNITEIEDKNATHEGITRALESLASCVHEGDLCVILFSSHGQLITDLDEDERVRDYTDHFDEAIVPYDALIAYDWHHSGYKGQNHLRDDELNYLLHEVRNGIGPSGELIVLFDACHSGDMSRAEEDASMMESSPRRGTADAFRIPSSELHQLKSFESRPIGWISISACFSTQNNYEVNIDGIWYGRLAYSFSKVIRRGITPKELVDEIQSLYKELPTDPNKPIQIIDYHIPVFTGNAPLLND
jgi:hypothetical protein